MNAPRSNYLLNLIRAEEFVIQSSQDDTCKDHSKPLGISASETFSWGIFKMLARTRGRTWIKVAVIS